MLIRYSIRRLLETIPTLFIISVIVFSLVLLIPGDRVLVMLGYSGGDIADVISKEVYAAMEIRLGVNDPIPLQYVRWLGRALQGDLGTSPLHAIPVMDIILARLPATIYLALASIILGTLIAIPLGVAAAVKQNTWVDHLANGVVLFGLVTPGFWVALMLVLLFGVYLGWLPTFGYTAPQDDFVEFLRHITLPTIVLALDFASNVIRFIRTDFIEQMREDYVRTARAKGLSERLVIWKHIFKNSMLATVTVLGFDISRLMGGSTVIESLFAYPGISFLLLQSIFNRDFATVQGVVIFIALMVVFMNYLADILYALLNPRIRYE
ncbi:MAG: ABC transporter permease [Chloroflexi bacterium]|nr:ABC transporter permease [Chloroflexota bacterium]MCI0779142.1 ABC transporter permease [Chloroflexota bacterium]MCI0815950.1 ABC transporter permease [Chloroflexota bacterium]MCI0888280.1 ABC transporter permease [Chloroflexota bacterium]